MYMYYTHECMSCSLLIHRVCYSLLNMKRVNTSIDDMCTYKYNCKMGMTRHNQALITGFSHRFLRHVWRDSGYLPLEVLDGVAHADRQRTGLGEEGDEGLDGLLQVS